MAQLTMTNIEHFTVTPEYLLEQGFSLTTPRRFYSKIRFTKSCWLWTAATRHGYGCMWKGVVQGDLEQAHIVSWLLHFGPYPDNLCVLHDCPDGDTRSCVNPAHLWLGTRDENQKDMAKKGRSPWGERSAQCKLTKEQVDAIRAERAKGRVQRVIGEQFGVTQGHVSDIVRFVKRAHG